jgi:hypothetical protein
MTNIAPMSSMIARAAKNTFTDAGTFFPANANIPKAKQCLLPLE